MELHEKDYPPLKRDVKNSLIDTGVLTENEFVEIKGKVNTMIRTELQFNFCGLAKEQVNDFEHFAIAVLSPPMND